MGPRRRRWLQRAALRIEEMEREALTARHGDRLAAQYAAFGAGSVVEAPQLRRGNTRSIAIGERTLVRAWSAFEALAPPGDVVIRVGDHCFVGYGVRFVAVNGIVIGDEVAIGHGSTIADTIHDYKGDSGDTWRADLKLGRPLTIESGAWIGNNSVVTGGITIGEDAIIGANSVVSRDVAPNTLVAGNPAKLQRRRKPDGEWEWLVDPSTVELEPPDAGAVGT